MALVDTLEGADNVGRATMMLSYTWGYKLGDILDALVDYCRHSGLDTRRTYVWMCCLCINQHRVQDAVDRGEVVSFEHFALEFSSRVKGIGHVLALLGAWRAPKYITRAWCIYELYMTMVLDCKLDIILPPGESQDFLQALVDGDQDLEAVWQALEAVDVRRADASVASDKEEILRQVEAGPGFAALNQRVRKKLDAWFCEMGEFEIRAYHRRESTCARVCETGCKAGTRVLQMLMDLSEFDRCINFGRYLLARLESRGLGLSLVSLRMRSLVGCSLMCVGDLEGARFYVEEAFRVCEARDEFTTPEGADVQRTYALVLAYGGDASSAVSIMGRAYSVVQAEGFAASHTLNVLVTMVLCLCSSSQHEQANFFYQQAQQAILSQGRKKMPQLARFLMILAYVDVRSGNLEGAQRKSEEAYDIVVGAGVLDAPLGAYVMTLIGWVKAAVGDLDGALVDCQASSRVLDSFNMSGTVPGIDNALVLSHIKQALGDEAGAASLKRRASLARSASGLVPLLRFAPDDFYA